MSTPASAFQHIRFTARRKVFTLFSPQFHFYDESGAVIAYVKQKAFKLKEDVRVYADESGSRELLRITARSILDFSVAYDVVDSSSGAKVGALKRKGWKSLVRDEWVLLDQTDREIGHIREDSALVAFLRRLPVLSLIPQSFVFEVEGQPAGAARQHFNPLIFRMSVDLADGRGRLDPRLAMAAVVLLMAIESRQES